MFGLQALVVFFPAIVFGQFRFDLGLVLVGYGDLAPKTAAGKMLASAVMILGYAIIAVPTGIVTSELTAARFRGGYSRQSCPSCGREGHDEDATHCKYCGGKLIACRSTPSHPSQRSPLTLKENNPRALRSADQSLL